MATKSVMSITDANGKFYEINEAGHIKGPNMNHFSSQWVFVGFSTHHWRCRPNIKFEDALKIPQHLVNKTPLYVFDIDHGTPRWWGRRIRHANV